MGFKESGSTGKETSLHEFEDRNIDFEHVLEKGVDTTNQSKDVEERKQLNKEQYVSPIHVVKD